MRPFPNPTRSGPRLLIRSLLLVGVGLVLAAPIGVLGPAGGSPVPAAPVRHAAPAVETVSIATLSAIGFDPTSFTVRPGDEVELVVTQMANFAHSFVLSPLPNFTFDPTASASNLTLFFRAHAPLVNLTLGSTVGSKAYANFTAPAVGSYEYVCIQPQHFQSGMHGEMVASTSSTTSSSSFPTTSVILVGVVLAIVVVVAVVLWMRRSKPPAAPP